MPSPESHHSVNVFHVGEVFPDADFRTLAEAVDRAPPGSRIVVGPGVYRESLLFDKPLEIVAAELEAGYGCDFSLAEVTQRRYAAVNIVGGEKAAATIASDGVVLRGICFEPGDKSAAISVFHGDAWIEECSFSGFFDAAGEFARPTLQSCLLRREGGVSAYFADRASCELRDCLLGCLLVNDASQAVLSGCKVSGDKAGVVIGVNSVVTLELCEISKHVSHGVVVADAGTAIVRGCQIVENGAAGIYVASGGRLQIDGCDIQRNRGAGIVLQASQRAFIRRSRIHRNAGAGVQIGGGSPCNLIDCHLTENTGGAWQLEPGCHLLQKESFCDDAAKAATDGQNAIPVECPFCLEVFRPGNRQNCHCPVCGWCFATSEAGQVTTPEPLEVACPNPSCRHTFPAPRSGADLCPECEQGFAWDMHGGNISVRCPECRQSIGFYKPGEVACFLCGRKVIFDVEGTILNS